MAQGTSISWTDNTFNPWWGCTKVSPGCDNCYAESFDKRVGGAHWGKGEPRRTFVDKHWAEPLKWNRDAEVSSVVSKVFCGSMCDVMDDEAPDGARARLWELIDQTPNLLWQLLTKRPHRYSRYLPSLGFKHPNVILGATTENQEFYDVRMKHLHDGAQYLAGGNDLSGRYHGRIRTFVSYEPALGPISMATYSGIAPDWVIFGGETGPRPRPMQQAWAENIKAECEQRGVSFFMKQMSARTPGAASALIPAHLLLRQFPERK